MFVARKKYFLLKRPVRLFFARLQHTRRGSLALNEQRRSIGTFKSNTDASLITPSLTGGDKNEEEKPTEVYLFPWRESQREDSSAWDSVAKYICTLINFAVASTQSLAFIPRWDDHALRIYWSHEFMEGAEQVLKVSTKNIFRVFLPEEREKYISCDEIGEIEQTTSTTTACEELEVPVDESSYVPSSSSKARKNPFSDDQPPPELDLDEIFEENLAVFFNSAITEFKAKGHRLVYRLEEITNSRIIECELIHCAGRGLDMRGLELSRWPLSSYGPFNLLKLPMQENQAEHAGDQGGECLERDMLRSRWRSLKPIQTIRLGVQMDCKELFCIYDGLTNEIIQGSESVSDTKHDIVLEATYNTATKKLSNWEVCDIDDFLNGNKFWVAEKHRKTDYDDDQL